MKIWHFIIFFLYGLNTFGQCRPYNQNKCYGLSIGTGKIIGEIKHQKPGITSSVFYNIRCSKRWQPEINFQYGHYSSNPEELSSSEYKYGYKSSYTFVSNVWSLSGRIAIPLRLKQAYRPVFTTYLLLGGGLFFNKAHASYIDKIEAYLGTFFILNPDYNKWVSDDFREIYLNRSIAFRTEYRPIPPASIGFEISYTSFNSDALDGEHNYFPDNRAWRDKQINVQFYLKKYVK